MERTGFACRNAMTCSISCMCVAVAPDGVDWKTLSAPSLVRLSISSADDEMMEVLCTSSEG